MKDDRLTFSVVDDPRYRDPDAICLTLFREESQLMAWFTPEAGVTWKSEAMFQEQVGHPISHVEIPAKDNATAIYAGAAVRGAAHPEAAKAWLTFITSPTAIKIFEGYGLKAYKGGGEAQ